MFLPKIRQVGLLHCQVDRSKTACHRRLKPHRSVKSKRTIVQECIPVGCVPPACNRTGGLGP